MSGIPASSLAQEVDAEMIRVAPEFLNDEEYQAWLDMIHEEIPNEGEDDAHYCEARED